MSIDYPAILRFKLEVTDRQEIEIPGRYKILSVAPGRNGYHIDMWARVIPDEMHSIRAFYIYGTGHPLPTGGGLVIDQEFIGTCVMSDGLVWHVFA